MSVTPFRETIPSGWMNATVVAKVFDINRSGAKVLQYLIVQGLLRDASFVLDTKDAVTYLFACYGTWSTRQNLKRGIRNLIDNDIIAEATEPDTYFVNKAYIKQ